MRSDFLKRNLPNFLTRAPKIIFMGLVFLLLPLAVFTADAGQKLNVSVSSSVPYDHCVDSIKNFDETGIDCGGATCPACASHCTNGIKDFDETGIDCGGALCAACSGGGGGGGGGGTVVLSQVSFTGKAAPYASIKILKDGILVSNGTSTALGDFNIIVGNLSTGNYHFTVYYVDSAGRRSASFITNTSISQQGQSVTVSNILLSPTIDADKREVKQGEPIAIFGEAAPGAEITLSLIRDDGNESIYHVTASANGNYQLSIDTATMLLGQYSIKARAILGVMQSEYTSPITFTVGEKTIIKEPDGKCPKKGDLNGDCRVNLVDFSIAAYWYKRDILPSFFSIEESQLNGDQLINLVDFSILAYYWTG